MKRFLFITFTFFFVSITYGQTFTVTELITINYKNYDDFDTYVTKKGYEYSITDNDALSENRSYSFKRGGFDNKAEYWIKYFKYYDGKTDSKTNVSWQTSKRTDYINIKNQIKSLGFKFIETKKDETTICIIYRKGKIEVQLYLGSAENTGGEMANYYEINVSILR